MIYRRLGRSGLNVSVLSFGSWVTFGKQIHEREARDCLAAAYDAGINYFDNAEAYGGGRSEQLMGAAIADLGWPRHSYVLSTKFFFGIDDGVNTKATLNRKYLLHAIDGSLSRLHHDFVDLVFCHRPDPNTPIEETVWALHNIVESGKALYWGTSEWSATAIQEAYDIAQRHHLHAPVMEQPEYNLIHRTRVEEEYAPLYESMGLGLTIWSPLASGLLTGKYKDGIPSDSRGALPGYDWLRHIFEDKALIARISALEPIAKDLGVTMAQLAIAWCVTNPHVSTVITGASRLSQLQDNLGALEAIDKITGDVKAKLDTVLTGAAAGSARS